MTRPPQTIDLYTAVLIVVANMIGTGVFTTLGLQAAVLPDGAALLLLWALGGLVALCGALCYAELAAALPRSGGEYHFLSRTYHPLLGQLAGWTSVTVGFAAPMALAAMAMGRYAATFLPVPPWAVAIGALVLVSAMHAFDFELGRRFQVASTLLKLAAIASICALGLALEPTPGSLAVAPSAATWGALWSAHFGVALISVGYAYSGWNAAAYVVEEVRDPGRTVPQALILGTSLVTLVYLLLNLTFLRTTAYPELSGTLEVAALSARVIFGPAGALYMNLAITLLLVSTMSAMALAGPRVLERMGQDLPALGPLAARNRRGAPTRAVLTHQGLALGFILTDSFEGVLSFAGFTLTLFALLTVVAVWRLRRREPDLPRPFRVPLYPLPPLLFAAVSLFALLHLAAEQPLPVLLSGLFLGALWWVLRRRG